LDLKKQQQKQKTTTKTNYKYENDIKIKTTTNTITNIKNECKSKNKWIKDSTKPGTDNYNSNKPKTKVVIK
jgi:hypothetical protein